MQIKSVLTSCERYLEYRFDYDYEFYDYFLGQVSKESTTETIYYCIPFSDVVTKASFWIVFTIQQSTYVLRKYTFMHTPIAVRAKSHFYGTT